MSSRVCLALAVASSLLLTGCGEVTSDHIIGEPGYGFWVREADTSSARPADTLFYDRAERLEGLWAGGWISEEDGHLYFVKQTGPATLRIAWSLWDGDKFSMTETEGVVSTLDGEEYLNVHTVNEEGTPEESKYWPLRLWSGEDKVILMLPDYDLFEDAVDAGTIEGVKDTSADYRIHITGKASLDSFVVRNERLAWDDADFLVLRRIMDVQEE